MTTTTSEQTTTLRVKCTDCQNSGVQTSGRSPIGKICNRCHGSGACDETLGAVKSLGLGEYIGRRRILLSLVEVNGSLGGVPYQWKLTYQQFFNQVPAAEVIPWPKKEGD